RKDVALDPHTLSPVFDKCVQLSLGRLHGDAILQSSDEVKEVASTILTIRPVQPERQPDLSAVIHQIGPRRHNANYFPSRTVHFHRLPNDRPTCKSALPQLVRENRNGGRLRRWSRCWRRPWDVGFALCE